MLSMHRLVCLEILCEVCWSDLAGAGFATTLAADLYHQHHYQYQNQKFFQLSSPLLLLLLLGGRSCAESRVLGCPLRSWSSSTFRQRPAAPVRSPQQAGAPGAVVAQMGRWMQQQLSNS